MIAALRAADGIVLASPGYHGGGECQAVQLGDGSIMLNMRNTNSAQREPYRGVYITRDLGQTWQPHPTHLNTLIEPACNGSLIRVDYDLGHFISKLSVEKLCSRALSGRFVPEVKISGG